MNNEKSIGFGFTRHSFKKVIGPLWRCDPDTDWWEGAIKLPFLFWLRYKPIKPCGCFDIFKTACPFEPNIDQVPKNKHQMKENKTPTQNCGATPSAKDEIKEQIARLRSEADYFQEVLDMLPENPEPKQEEAIRRLAVALRRL
jgi:hypothetical protein